MARERRNWTSGEDALLKKAVSQGVRPFPGYSYDSCSWQPFKKSSRDRWDRGLYGTLYSWSNLGLKSGPVNWHNVAALISGRTNKDCRKRWHYTVAAGVTKGTWTAEEDKQLCLAVEKHGTKWSHVALEMEKRNGDQCSKRWNDTIDPTIDRSAWTPDKASRSEYIGMQSGLIATDVPGWAATSKCGAIRSKLEEDCRQQFYWSHCDKC